MKSPTRPAALTFAIAFCAVIVAGCQSGATDDTPNQKMSEAQKAAITRHKKNQE